MMDFFTKWKDKVAHYFEVRLQLVKLTIIERVSNVLSYLILVFISLFLGVSVLIFLGIGVAMYFSYVLNSRVGGFFITAGFYVLLLVILFALRKVITNKFSDVFIRILTAGEEEEEKESKNDEHRNIKVD